MQMNGSFLRAILGISENIALPFCDLSWAISGGKIVKSWPSQEINILRIIFLY